MVKSDKFKETIIDEIDYVIKKMDESPSAEKKLYYFSAVYAVMQRVFNLEYDPNLVYAHFVTNNTYNYFIERLRAIEKGKEDTIPITEEQFARLTELTKELADNISEKKDITPTLKKLSVLAYSTTGNGYYLLQKGLLKI